MIEYAITMRLACLVGLIWACIHDRVLEKPYGYNHLDNRTPTAGRPAGVAMSDTLTFMAEIIKVQTMESGAIRLTVDLPEHETVLMAKLAECKRWGAVLDVTATPKTKEDKPQIGGRLK